MRSLKRARDAARRCRLLLDASDEDLFDRVVAYLKKAHKVSIVPVEPEFLDGGNAEIFPAQRSLCYNRKLDADPFERLRIILHETGHLELHHRLKRVDVLPDLITAAIYANDGPAALARYNPHAQEEAQANAFASEFLCPSDEVFNLWLEKPGVTSTQIAASLGLPVDLVRAQLAEALATMVLSGDESGDGSRTQDFEYDERQLSAARFVGPPALVNAGPGTGKTATLVRRVAYLLDELEIGQKAEPEHLLMLTFSNEAVDELHRRFVARFGEETAARLKVLTFHGFGVSFLHHFGHHAGLETDFNIIDEAAQEELVSSVLGQVDCHRLLKLSRLHETVEDIVRNLNYLKDRLHTPDSLETALTNWRPTETEKESHEKALELLAVFRRYEQLKMEKQLLDFADLIALPVKVLEEQPQVRELCRQQYKWPMVDEYQDVCRGVATLLRLLCGPDNPPWVVGDQRQAIFRFRGAAPENVTQFREDFPQRKLFHLNTNYRSCPQIVEAANQLAGLMHEAESHSDVDFERWEAHPDNPAAFGSNPVVVAFGNSDAAERQGIVGQVKAWREKDVPFGEIAILARRNIDVREIVLALGENGVPATTSGLATAEGAAGDLANIITYADRPRTSLPRLAQALGGKRYDKAAINAVIERALETMDAEGKFATDGYVKASDLVDEIVRVGEAMLAEKYSADAFTAICIFLFDGSEYLRHVLNASESTERALALDEIITAISKAASYRFSHRGIKPWVSRKGFGESFRRSLSTSAHSLVPPKRGADAVRVMTCHASKGLEFPFVIVAGQTLNRSTDDYVWLPPVLQPPQNNDKRQADSLLFVSVTRAKRAALVTYADTHGGTTRSKSRDTTQLLDQWIAAHDIRPRELESQVAGQMRVELHKVWGGQLSRPLAARTLNKERNCAIRTYLTDYLGLRYPVNHNPLYPIFYESVRLSLEVIIKLAHGRGEQIDVDDAQAIFLDQWKAAEVTVDHAHEPLFSRIGERYVRRFAANYQPQPLAEEFLDLRAIEPVTGFPLRLELVACYRSRGNEFSALSFRPESLAKKTNEEGVKWGEFAAYRVPFVLLRKRFGNLQAFVFSGEDGQIYPFVWPAERYYKQSVADLEGRLKSFARGVFEQQIKDYDCERCESRPACPFWLNGSRV